MKLMILTTETLHHTFFVKEIKKVHRNIIVLSEKIDNTRITYNTDHPFEIDRENFETFRWFNGSKAKINDFAETINVTNINSSITRSLIKKNNPDVIIVFGTGILKKELLKICGNRIFNLHGGNPIEYRGLDSHLWSIFHNDFENLITTIHKVDENLDTGDIVIQDKIPLWPKMKIHELRSSNTEVCVSLTLSLLEMFLIKGNLQSTKQSKVGKYYTAMPGDLKSLIKSKFEKYINKKF